MRVVYLGETEFVGRDLLSVFRLAGHDVVTEDGCGEGPADLVVDNRARSADEVLAALKLAGECEAAHYVLISSHEVYPPCMRSAPWRPEDLTLGGTPQYEPATLGEGARRAELQTRFQQSVPWTILRPAIVEGPGDPRRFSSWYVDRILDGGPVVLPDGNMLLYRHVWSRDLAGAALAVAGRREAFGQTLNVVSHGVLDGYGHAAMLRDGLEMSVEFRYVPASRWRMAGLSLPMGEGPSSSFIAASPLLASLGWKPAEELAFGMALGRHYGATRLPQTDPLRAVELKVLEEFEAEGGEALERGWLPPCAPLRSPPHWMLRAWPGQPDGLSLIVSEDPLPLPTPRVRVLRLAVGQAEEQMLLGQRHSVPGLRALGHNALVEVLDSDESEVMPTGSLAVPLAQHKLLLGVDTFGYGMCIAHTSPIDLAAVTPGEKDAALLANPLAALVEGLDSHLKRGQEPVWVCGQTVDAALAAWLARDVDREVVHIADAGLQHDEFPCMTLPTAIKALDREELRRPSLIVCLLEDLDLSRAGDLLLEGGAVAGWVRPHILDANVPFHPIPFAATSLERLRDAQERLRRWSDSRDLEALVGPALPLDAFWDLFLPEPFRLPFLDCVGS